MTKQCRLSSEDKGGSNTSASLNFPAIASARLVGVIGNLLSLNGKVDLDAKNLVEGNLDDPW